MRERYGKSDRSLLMRTHVQTAGCSLTEQQPLNNIVRVAYQAMAGVLGGCQSLHTDSMDETLGLPTEQAVRVALRTQQILAYETGVTRTVDPLAGSWFVEGLTDEMESGANEIIREIDDMGGVVDGIHKGYFRRSIAEASYRFGQEMEAGDRLIVGVNAFTEGNQEQCSKSSRSITRWRPSNATSWPISRSDVMTMPSRSRLMPSVRPLGTT